MDIRVLYTIVAIAEHGSFLAASRALNLSPAAVSLHVKIIEDELGATLFDRSVRPPVLTDAGRRTLERARRVLEVWEQLGENGPSEVAGVLAVGAVPTAVTRVLAPALAELRAGRPQLRVHLTTDDVAALEERLSRGMVDAAVTVRPTSPPPGWRFEPILREPFEVVAPADLAGATDAELLAGAPYLRFQRHGAVAHLIEQELTRRKLRLEAAMEIDTVAGIVALVAAGLGVSILPAGRAASAGGAAVRTVPFGEPELARQLGLLWRADHPKAPQILALLAALSTAAARTLPRPRDQEDQGVDQGDADREPDQVAEVHAEHELADGHLEEPRGRDDG